MPSSLDLTGQQFGHLSVFERAKGKTRVYWHCRCDCGAETVVQSSHLRNGSVISCGCLGKARRDAALRHGSRRRAGTASPQAAIRKVMREYRQSALTDEREFMLTEADFTRLLFDPCFYCGSPPSREVRLRSGARHLVGGIDRRDNSKGYTPDNAVPCCRSCNLRKHTKDAQVFIAGYAPAHLHRATKKLIPHPQGSPFDGRLQDRQWTDCPSSDSSSLASCDLEAFVG